MLIYDDMTKSKKDQFTKNSSPIDIWESIGRRWTILILKDLEEYNILRFNDFLKHHPKISNTVLSKRLEKLRKLGLINKKASFDDKPLIEYELTESGIQLGRFFDSFSLWAKKNIEKGKKSEK